MASCTTQLHLRKLQPIGFHFFLSIFLSFLVGFGVTLQPSLHLFHGVHLEEIPDIIFYTESFPLLFNYKGQLQPPASYPNNITHFLVHEDLCQNIVVNELAEMSNTSYISNFTLPISAAIEHRSDEVDCRRVQTIRNLSLHTNSFLAHHQEFYNLPLIQPSSKHSKRAFTFISDFLSYCCEVATHSQLRTQNENLHAAYKEVNSLKKFVKQEHAELVQTHKSLNNFTQHVTSSIKNFAAILNDFAKEREFYELAISSDINAKSLLLSLIEVLSSQLYISQYHRHLHIITETCKNHQLPSVLISADELRQQLQKLQASIASSNMALAIPFSEILLYYQLQLSSCYFTPQETVLHLNVPLQPAHQKCKLFTYQRLPMIWKNYSCHLDSEDFYIATCDESIHYIPKNSERCNPEKSNLCLLPRFSGSPVLSFPCIKNILSIQSIEVLKQSCPFTCNPLPSSAVIHQIAPTVFYVTPGKFDLILQCFNNDTSHIQHSLPKNITGLYELQIPCNCQLMEESFILVNRLHLCDNRTSPEPIIANLLPTMWATLPSLRLDPLQKVSRPTFQDFSDIIQPDWMYNMPPFAEKNILDTDIFTPAEPPQSWTDIITASPTKTYIFLTWCTLLSLLIFYLQCVTIRNLRYRLDAYSLQATLVPQVITSPRRLN